MFCESYRKALSEAVATGERLPCELQLHLAGCGACESAFAAEQRLFASIDSAMSAAVNVDIFPASLLPRVREQVALVPERAAWRVLLAVFAVAPVLVTVLAVSVWHLRHPVSGLPTSGNVAVVPSVSSTAEHAASASPVLAGPPALRPSSRRGTALVRPIEVRSEPEVLVSADEQLGFERYAARLRSRAPQLYARVAINGDSTFRVQPLEIAEIDVVQLAIAPLESGESN